MTVRDKAAIITESNTQFPDNVLKEITAERVRNFNVDIADSYANTSALSSGEVGMKSATDGVLEASGISADANNVTSTKSILAPDNSYFVGGTAISNAGFNILARLATGESFLPVAYEVTDSGSENPRMFRFASDTTTPAVADQSETFTGATIQFRIINSNTGTALRYNFFSNAVSTITDCNLTIRVNSHTDPNPVFDYKRATGGTGFDIPVGAASVNIPGGTENKVGAFFRAGQELFVTLTAGASQTLSLAGQTLNVGGTNETVPFVETFGKVGEAEDVRTFRQPLEITGDVTITSANVNVYDQRLLELTATANTTITIAAGANISLIDLYVSQGAGQLTIAAADSSGVLLNGQTSRRLTEHSGARLTRTATTDHYAVIFGASVTDGGGGVMPPVSGSARLYHGLSATNNPASIDVSTLTLVNNPTNPVTIASSAATAGQYYIILIDNADDIASITDTVLGQNVTSLFTKTTNVRTFDTLTFNSYVIGPLNAGFNETYVVRF